MIGLIWAQARGGVIGADGGLPWRLPEDQAHFRAVTGSSTVVMGRATWESLPERFRPLPGRRNVVVTRQRGWHAEGAVVQPDLDGFLREAAARATRQARAGHEANAANAANAAQISGGEDVWVIGGAEVYRRALPFANVVERTELDLDVDGDTHAPELPREWVVTRREPATGWLVSASGLRYRFERLAPLGLPSRPHPAAHPGPVGRADPAGHADPAGPADR